MTFRIDCVMRLGDGRWQFGIKGYKGQGVYCRLWTDPRGLGLEALFGMMVEGPGEPVIGPGEFAIPSDADQKIARVRLSIALHNLEWGPEVDQRNKILPGPDQ